MLRLWMLWRPVNHLWIPFDFGRKVKHRCLMTCAVEGYKRTGEGQGEEGTGRELVSAAVMMVLQ